MDVGGAVGREVSGVGAEEESNRLRVSDIPKPIPVACALPHNLGEWVSVSTKTKVIDKRVRRTKNVEGTNYTYN